VLLGKPGEVLRRYKPPLSGVPTADRAKSIRLNVVWKVRTKLKLTSVQPCSWYGLYENDGENEW